MAVIDGSVVSRPAWATTRITKNSVIQVRSVVQGGDGSNPFAIILTIAVLVAAPYLAGAILPAAASATLVSGAAAVIGFGGVLAVNALFPPRFPDDDASPTQKRQYSLSGGANRARPHEPFLLLLGQHRVFPDLAAREYTQFTQEQSQDTRTPVAATGGEPPPSIWGSIIFDTPIGETQQTSSYTAAQVKVWNTQILYQLFDFGIGNLLLANHRIQETLLAEFSDVETQAQENITLVDGAVDSIRGGDFMPGVPITRRTEAKTVKIAPQIISQNFELNEQGNVVGGSNAFTVEYRKVGGCELDVAECDDVLPFISRCQDAIEANFLLHGSRRSIRCACHADNGLGRSERPPLGQRDLVFDQRPSGPDCELQWAESSSGEDPGHRSNLRPDRKPQCRCQATDPGLGRKRLVGCSGNLESVLGHAEILAGMETAFRQPAYGGARLGR